MTSLKKHVFWSCLLTTSFAKPLTSLFQSAGEQRSYDSSLIVRSSDKNSVQILYKENVFGYAHGWSAYFGPVGVSVDPCTISPFSRVFHSIEQATSQQIRYSDVDDPPPVPAGDWVGLDGLYRGIECAIMGDGINLPVLQCGSNQVATFSEDPGRGQPTMTCSDGHRYHRAYYTEYTA